MVAVTKLGLDRPVVSVDLGYFEPFQAILELIVDLKKVKSARTTYLSHFSDPLFDRGCVHDHLGLIASAHVLCGS